MDRQMFNIDSSNEKRVMSALDTIADTNTSWKIYRQMFVVLGEELGKVINQYFPKTGNTMIACPNEDADWLVNGIISLLGSKNVSLSVYWSDRATVGNVDGKKLEISPIISSYEEPCEGCETLIVAKSIISTSCVVRTQLTHLIEKITPKRIIIAAPVMYKDAEPNLLKEFPTEISSKFHFICFAVDGKREGSTVIPGIGGFITKRLGLGDTLKDNNKYIPELVKERALQMV